MKIGNYKKTAALFAALFGFCYVSLGDNIYFSRGTDIEGDDTSSKWSNSLRWSVGKPADPGYYNPESGGYMPGEGDTVVISPNSGFSGTDSSTISPIILDQDATIFAFAANAFAGPNRVSGIRSENGAVLTLLDNGLQDVKAPYDAFVFNTDNPAMANTSFTIDTDIMMYTYRYGADDKTSFNGCKGFTMNFEDGRTITLRGLDEQANDSLNIRFNHAYKSEGIANAQAIFNVNSTFISRCLRLTSWNESMQYHHLGTFYVGGSESNIGGLYIANSVTAHLQKAEGATVIGIGGEMRIASSAYVYLHGNRQVDPTSTFYFGACSGINYEGIGNLSGILYMQGYNFSAKSLGFSVANALGIIDFAGDDPDKRVLKAGEKTTLAFLSMANIESGSELRLRNFDEETCRFLLGKDVNIEDYKIGYYDESGEVKYEWFKSEDLVDFEGNEYYSYTTTLVVPEASTLAAILGALSLGFAFVRRRK